MKLQQALIVHKKSAYETYFKSCRSPRLGRLSALGDEGLAHIRRSHEAHYETLEAVERTLKAGGIGFKHQYRGVPFDEKRYDLIISVGGDGTFLDAARYAKLKPVLGVNSDVKHSVGRLCVTDRAGFQKSIARILAGRFGVLKMSRLRLVLNGAEWTHTVLNDILICHACPAAMSHYFLGVGRLRERQRSSGVWVSTAAGSTGAMHSTGGRVMPAGSGQMQYRPRELFDGHGVRYRLRGGVLPKGSHILFVSQMEEGVIYADGHHTPIPLKYGEKLRVSVSSDPVRTIRLAP